MDDILSMIITIATDYGSFIFTTVYVGIMFGYGITHNKTKNDPIIPNESSEYNANNTINSSAINKPKDLEETLLQDFVVIGDKCQVLTPDEVKILVTESPHGPQKQSQSVSSAPAGELKPSDSVEHSRSKSEAALPNLPNEKILEDWVVVDEKNNNDIND